MEQTKRWIVDKNVYDLKNDPGIRKAAEMIAAGELVAFPTETVYGLGANAFSAAASEKIFRAKGRPPDNPLIVHLSSVAQLDGVVGEIPAVGEKLIAAFWPGPLTLVLPKGEQVASPVAAGLPTVAVRMPSHPVAEALIDAAGVPIAAPSANRSGKPSPTTADHVLADLYGRIAGVLDGGPTGVGVESTVVAVEPDVLRVLRPGGVTQEQLQQVAGKTAVVGVDEKDFSVEKPPSPGMKYRHYAPGAPLFIVTGGAECLQKIVDRRRREGVKVGVLTTEERADRYRADVVRAAGQRSDLSSVARALYSTLRAFDETDVDEIYSESFPVEGVGEAIMNRLQKASGGRFVRCD